MTRANLINQLSENRKKKKRKNRGKRRGKGYDHGEKEKEDEEENEDSATAKPSGESQGEAKWRKNASNLFASLATDDEIIPKKKRGKEKTKVKAAAGKTCEPDDFDKLIISNVEYLYKGITKE